MRGVCPVIRTLIGIANNRGHDHGQHRAGDSVKQLTLNISIPADRYVALYSGAVRDVQAVTIEGLRIRFPGKILQRFLTHDGVHGRFVIRFDDNNKFMAIEKIV